jgi:Cro/C1-type HTH DNA-binding domain
LVLREQVYRLVTSTPQRLNMDVLAALCDILGCGPQDLIEVDAKFDTGIPPMADQYEVILVDRGAWVTPTGARICSTAGVVVAAPLVLHAPSASATGRPARPGEDAGGVRA